MTAAPVRPRWQTALLAAWTHRGPLACLLWPLSLLYGLLVWLRRRLHEAGLRPVERLPVPVLVVGNVVAGGGGKTPAVVAIVEHLQARGLRVGVISRGYGRRDEHTDRLVQPDCTAQAVGDEPLLIHRRTGAPVAVGRRRVDAARHLLAAHPDTDLLVSDDGLQHLALARDLEVCVFDARGTGNGWLLPAGPLREPWPRPLRPADPPCLTLHTAGAATAGGFGSRRRLADHARRGDGEVVPLASLRGAPLHALAGIAHPDAFFSMLRAEGLMLSAADALTDHFDFDSWKPPMDAGEWLICTEKDAVKLWPLAPRALAVPLHFEPDPAFWRALDARLAPVRARQLSSPDGPPIA